MPDSLFRLFVQDFRQVRPGAANGLTAARAGTAVAVPLLTLMALDRLDWAVFCVFGALTAIYGRTYTQRARINQQAQAGLALVLAVTAGTAAAMSSHPTFWIVFGGSVTAMLMAVVADLAEWRPPGGLFGLFGFAVCASQADVSWRTVLIAAALATAAASFAIVVSSIGPQGPTTARARRSARAHLSDPATVRHAIRHFVAPLLTGSAAVSLDIGHPYWGMVASIVPLTSPSLREMVFRGAHRLIGTLLGLVLTAVILAFEPSAAVLVIFIIVAQMGAEMLIMRHYALALVFVTPLALLMGQLVHPLPLRDLISQRAVETLIGVIIGLVVAWATRRRS